MITHNIKWFLCLSVAAHAAVLTAWQTPVRSPGSSGRTVQLSITQRAGDRIEQPLAAIDSAAPPVQTQAAPATRITSYRAVTTDAAPRPVKNAAQPLRPAALPVMTTSTSAAAASNILIQKEETDRHLRSSVMELISRELTYPAIARRKGWQGVVKLELHIEADGAVSRLQVDETSGYTILDRAAMDCLQLASIPGAARWLHGQPIDIVVPVEYRLIDG